MPSQLPDTIYHYWDRPGAAPIPGEVVVIDGTAYRVATAHASAGELEKRKLVITRVTATGPNAAAVDGGDLDDSFYEPVAVFVPTTDSEASAAHQRCAAIIPPRSALLAATGLPDDDDAGARLVVYYEEPGPAVNVVSWADRAMIAHGRLWSDRLKPGVARMPTTHKVLALPRGALACVGVYSPWGGGIILKGDIARAAVAAWLNLGPGEDMQSELYTTSSAAHRARRDALERIAEPAAADGAEPKTETRS